MLPCAETLLSEAEMAMGSVEIGWRLMLPRCLVVPPHVCGLVAHHVQNHAAVVEKHKEGEALVAQLTGYAERAMLLCMPIICSGHWTLLVVQRAGAVLELDEEPVGPDAPLASKGCSKCRGKRCKEPGSANISHGWSFAPLNRPHSGI